MFAGHERDTLHRRSVVSGPAVCDRCRHHARGKAVYAGPPRTGRQGGEIRPSLSGGDYICSREGLAPATPDPVTGFAGLPSGPDCRDLNPAGECEHYSPGLTADEVRAGMVFSVLAVVAMLAALLAL